MHTDEQSAYYRRAYIQINATKCPKKHDKEFMAYHCSIALPGTCTECRRGKKAVSRISQVSDKANGLSLKKVSEKPVHHHRKKQSKILSEVCCLHDVIKTKGRKFDNRRLQFVSLTRCCCAQTLQEDLKKGSDPRQAQRAPSNLFSLHTQLFKICFCQLRFNIFGISFEFVGALKILFIGHALSIPCR